MRGTLIQCVILLFATSVHAVTYTATNAVCDSSLQPMGCTSHGITIPGLVDHLDITDTFLTEEDGAVTLNGKATSGSSGFDFSFFFTATSGPPKLEFLAPNIYDTIPINQWRQYHLIEGFLAGFGDFAHLVFNVGQFGPPLQVGIGANNKNLNFGAASWFSLSNFDGFGDLNIDLANVPEVDEPPPWVLLLLGVSIWYVASRFKNRR